MVFERVPRKLKYDAVMLSSTGVKETEVAESLGISLRTLQRAKQRLRDYGDIEGGKQKQGAKPKLSPGMEEVFYNYS
jgi:transposase